MKKYKKILIIVLVTALIVPATAFVEVPQVEAACSYQGYVSSGGKCAKSFKNKDKHRFSARSYEAYDDDDDDDDYDDYRDIRYDRILHLLALIEQLQKIIAAQHGSSGVPDSGSEIDIKTLSAINVDEDSAKLRGDIDFNNSDTAMVWFEYGKDKNNLNKKTTEINLDDSDSRVFSRTVTNLDEDTLYYFRAIGEDEDGEEDRGMRLSFRTDDGDEDDVSPVAITKEADDITDDSAELNGSVDMNDFDNGRVFFVYGESENKVEDVEDDFDSYTDIDEDGDSLQKVLVDSDLDGDDDYTRIIDNLDEDTDHYFSMCVEYEDVDGDDVLVCGVVKDFTTSETSTNDEEPTANTDDVDEIASTTAELNGSVNMNDFDNGLVFFAYGTSEGKVEAIADDYDTYSSIVEDAGLSKVSVDNDLDTMNSFTKDVIGLKAETEYFASICVQFEDSNNNDKLICGDVERFETDAS